MTETHICPTCFASSSKYWHRITPGLVNALVKFKRAVIAKGENSVHTRRDMDETENELSKGEYANWTMLRYHGLVAHDKKAGKGYWLLTHRGSEFLKGNIQIPARVQVMNNHVIDHDERHVTVSDVWGTVPYFEEVEDKDRERLPIDMAQVELFA